jgi:hypothetical protein
MELQHKHKLAFATWMGAFKTWLQSERGRSSRLARYLGVGRQNVSRWFVVHASGDSVPAWAAVTANVWYHQQLAEENALLSRPQEKVWPLYKAPEARRAE